MEELIVIPNKFHAGDIVTVIDENNNLAVSVGTEYRLLNLNDEECKPAWDGLTDVFYQSADCLQHKKDHGIWYLKSTNEALNFVKEDYLDDSFELKVKKAADKMGELNLDELRKIEEELKSDMMESVPDIQSWIDYGIRLSTQMAFANSEMVTWRKIWQEKKAKMYEQYAFNLKAYGMENATASVIKEYVGCKCADEEANYMLAERVSRGIIHRLDLIRTIISSLRSEMQNLNFNQKQNS